MMEVSNREVITSNSKVSKTHKQNTRVITGRMTSLMEREEDFAKEGRESKQKMLINRRS